MRIWQSNVPEIRRMFVLE